MDYLTIIATRSLVLFPQLKPTHHRTFSSSSSGSTYSPRTPTSCLPTPTPIAMAIHSLMTSDVDCAYFLVTHILTHPSLYPSAIAHGGVNKEVLNEAETMVWLEIDKAKVFIRKLGQWFAKQDEVTEGDLERLALESGLGWKEDKGMESEGEEEMVSDKYSHTTRVEEVHEHEHEHEHAVAVVA